MSRTLVIGAVVFALLLGEAWLSARNERRLRARGAVEPPDDVYPVMRVAYPGAFVLMVLEALVRPAAGGGWLVAGTIVFLLAKLVKYVAIRTLGDRWTFRVLVLPGVPLVASGIYRRMRHPNSVAVAGEFIGAALMLHAPVTGVAGAAGFAALLRVRIRVEGRALAEAAASSSPRRSPTTPGAKASY
jgi:methyltransferase